MLGRGFALVFARLGPDEEEAGLLAHAARALPPAALDRRLGVGVWDALVVAAGVVLITSLGHRVYDRCTGQIAAASPPTTAAIKVAPDKTCPRRGIEEFSQAEVKRQEEIAALPERLFPRQIDQVLAPIQAKIHECYVEFGEPSGTAKVNLIIGNQGKLSSVTLPAPFDKSDIAVCLRSQIKSAVFPKFRGEPMTVDYVYQVQ